MEVRDAPSIVRGFDSGRNQKRKEPTLRKVKRKKNILAHALRIEKRLSAQGIL